jgi:hypothetical protein
MNAKIAAILAAVVFPATLLMACSPGSASQGVSSSDRTTQEMNQTVPSLDIRTTGGCSWLTTIEVKKAIGDTVLAALSSDDSCIYSMVRRGLGFEKTITSMLNATPGIFEENKQPGQYNVLGPPTVIPGLGADAYCINIGALGDIRGGGRIDVKLANGKVYQIWGTYSCDQLLPLAKIAITLV